MSAAPRLVVVNRLDGGSVLNGTGGGPARAETSPFTMEQALLPNRELPWVFPSNTSGTFQFDCSVGSTGGADTAFLHGWDVLTAPAGGITCEVFNNADITYTPGGTYSPAGGATTPAVGVQYRKRDFGIDLSGSYAQTFWRFVFTWTPGQAAAWRLGRLMLGPAAGPSFGESAGSELSLDPNRNIVPNLGGGALVFANRGQLGEISLPWGSILAADKVKLRSLAEAFGTASFKDHDDEAFECLVNSLSRRRRRGGAGLYDMVLSMRILP